MRVSVSRHRFSSGRPRTAQVALVALLAALPAPCRGQAAVDLGKAFIPWSTSLLTALRG